MSIDLSETSAALREPLEWLEGRPPIHLGIEQALLGLEPAQLWRLSYSQTARGVSAVAVSEGTGQGYLEAGDKLGGLGVLGAVENARARTLVATDATLGTLGAPPAAPWPWLRLRRTLAGMTLAEPRVTARGRMAEPRDVPALSGLTLPALVAPGDALAGPAWQRAVGAGDVALHESAGKLLSVVVLGAGTRRHRSVDAVFAIPGPDGEASAEGVTSLLARSKVSAKPLHVSIEAGAAAPESWARRCGFALVGIAYEYAVAPPGAASAEPLSARSPAAGGP